jgi:hypothetical protein
MKSSNLWARALAIALWAGVAVLVPGVAFGHIAYDGSGRFRHQSHSRDLNFFNGVDDGEWRAETRNAQINIRETMGGSLRLNSTSHGASVIHVVDDNYGATGWVGYAYNWGYHAGHGHAQLNLYYRPGDRRTQQGVACHEVGHFLGLAHSTDATDCMHTPADYSNASVLLGTAHRDQLRSTWNGWGH